MKEKIYLDVNMIYGYFLAKQKELKGRRKEFEEPSVIRTLRENKDNVEYKVSVITESETKRRLITELSLVKEEAKNMWDSFLTYLSTAQIKDVEIDWNFIREIVENVKIKKRISNLIHLSFAKVNDLYFLTGDEEILEKCKRFYPKIINYTEFRKLVEKDLSERNKNNNYEGTEIYGKDRSSWWKKSKGKSTPQYLERQGVQSDSYEHYEESDREAAEASWLILLDNYIDSSALQDYDTKLLRLEVNYTDDTEGKTSYLFSNTTENKHGLQSMLKPWIVLMNYQANDQPLFITTSRKTLSAIPLKVTATENEAITKLTFNQSFSSNTNLTLAFGYLGTVNTRGDTG